MSEFDPNREDDSTEATADRRNDPVDAPGPSTGGWRRALPLILAAALLSASLSALGTFVVATVALRPADAAASQQAANAQVISLTESTRSFVSRPPSSRPSSPSRPAESPT